MLEIQVKVPMPVRTKRWLLLYVVVAGGQTIFNDVRTVTKSQ